jgi:hypothetical protein
MVKTALLVSDAKNPEDSMMTLGTDTRIKH